MTTNPEAKGAQTLEPVAKPAPIVSVPNLHAPEYFASDMIGAGFDGNSTVVRMTFASNRATFDINGNSQLHQVENVRIVMTTASAIQMINFLGGFVRTATLNQTEKPADQPMQ